MNMPDSPVRNGEEIEAGMGKARVVSGNPVGHYYHPLCPCDEGNKELIWPDTKELKSLSV